MRRVTLITLFFMHSIGVLSSFTFGCAAFRGFDKSSVHMLSAVQWAGSDELLSCQDVTHSFRRKGSWRIKMDFLLEDVLYTQAGVGTMDKHTQAGRGASQGRKVGGWHAS
jgi:hypothetical protein